MRAGIGAAVSGLILTPARPLALFDSLILWLEQSPPKKERAKSEGVKERLQPGSLIQPHFPDCGLTLSQNVTSTWREWARSGAAKWDKVQLRGREGRHRIDTGQTTDSAPIGNMGYTSVKAAVPLLGEQFA